MSEHELMKIEDQTAKLTVTVGQLNYGHVFRHQGSIYCVTGAGWDKRFTNTYPAHSFSTPGATIYMPMDTKVEPLNAKLVIS